MRRLLNSSDVAKLIGVSPSALSNWRSRERTTGRLPDPDFITGYAKGGQKLWYPETISAFLEKQMAEQKKALDNFLSDC